MKLVLEARGCPFHATDGWCKGHREDASDIGNYRVGAYNNKIRGSDGRQYTVEFGFAGGIRTVSKFGKPLKHPKRDPEYADYLRIDTEFEDETGCWRNCKLESEIYNMHLPYSKAGILQAVNYICGEDVYDELEVL